MLGDLGTIASGRLGAVVLSLVTVILTTRMLGPAGYATVALVGVVVTLIFNATTAWTSISVRRYGREDLELSGSMHRLTWNRALIGAPLLLVCVAVVVALKALGGLPGDFSWLLVGIAIATAVATILGDHWICLVETSGKMRVSALSQVLSQAAYAGALVALFSLGIRASPQTILLLSLASATLMVLAITPSVWRSGLAHFELDSSLLRRMLWLSTPMIGLVLSQYVFASVDIVILRVFRSASNVGVYAVAYRAYSVLASVAVTPNIVLVPLFVSLQMAGRRGLIHRYFTTGVGQGIFLIALCGGLTVSLLPPLVPVVFSHSFDGATPPLVVLVIGLAFLFAAYLLVPVLDLYEETRAGAAINVAAAVINIAGDVLMVGVLGMGVIAPAIATSAALAFMFAAFYVRSRRLLGTEGWPHPTVLLPLVGGAAAALLLGGVQGALVGVLGTITIAAAVVRWRSPFNRADAELIAKLDLPSGVKRLVVKVLTFVT